MCLLLALALAAPAGIPHARAQESEPAKAPDTFFAGTVAVFTPAKISVSRVVLGKTEKRDFSITPDTKIEGKLRARVRVTVRYISGDDGDTATLIVVRTDTKKK
jgi:hypothetical protein